MGTNPQLLPASSVQRDGDQILDLRGVVRKNPLIIPPPSLHLLTSTIHSLAPRGNEPGYEDVSLICLHSLSPSSLTHGCFFGQLEVPGTCLPHQFLHLFGSSRVCLFKCLSTGLGGHAGWSNGLRAAMSECCSTARFIAGHTALVLAVVSHLHGWCVGV